MEEVIAGLWKFMVDTWTTPENYAILGATMALVWATEPVLHAIVWMERLHKWRDGLYTAKRVGKRLGASMWCEIIVHLPIDGIQPPLCGPRSAAAGVSPRKALPDRPTSRPPVPRPVALFRGHW